MSNEIEVIDEVKLAKPKKPYKGFAPACRLFAVQCIKGLLAKQCDPLLLFWLKSEKILQTVEFGRQMQAFMQSQNGWKRENFEDVNYRQVFFQTIRDYRKANGIHPICRRNFVMSKGLGGKEDCIKKSIDANWAPPYQSFCLQTRSDNKGTLFFIVKTFQDGLHLLRDLHVQREYNGTPTPQVYEHAWGDYRVCRLLVDWELEEHKIGGVWSVDEARELSYRFPEWFVEQLRCIGAISADTEVEVVVKNKCRCVAGKGEKVSYHFMFNIVGIPKYTHKAVCDKLLDPYLADLKRAKKNFSEVPAGSRRLPIWGVDFQTLHGSQGFSTLCSLKSPGDPTARLDYHLRIKPPQANGKGMPEASVWQHNYKWHGAPCSPDAMDPGRLLEALYTASFTPPAADTVMYSQDFFLVSPPVCNLMQVPREDSNLTPAPRQDKVWATPSAKRQRVSQADPLRARAVSSSSVLPAYLQQYLSKRGRYTEYTALPCIPGMLAGLRRFVPDEGNEMRACRVNGCPCPVHLCRDPPEVHVHHSNGVFVVARGGEVFMACSYCKMPEGVPLADNVVAGSVREWYQWCRYDEKTWGEITGGAGLHTHTHTDDMVVCT